MPNPKTRGNKGVINKILRETKSLVIQLTLLFFFVFQTKMFVGPSTCLVPTQHILKQLKPQDFGYHNLQNEC